MFEEEKLELSDNTIVEKNRWTHNLSVDISGKMITEGSRHRTTYFLSGQFYPLDRKWKKIYEEILE